MVHTLDNIPAELQHDILEYLDSFADLRSLCLVAKQISSIAKAHLYHEFSFPFMTPDAAERLCNALAKSNDVLIHVKIFRLGMCFRFCSGRLENAFLRLLLNFPDDCLAEFHLDGHVLRRSHQDYLWAHQLKIYEPEITIVSEEMYRRHRFSENIFTDNGLINELQELERLGLGRRMGSLPASLRIHGMSTPRLWDSGIVSPRMLPLSNIRLLSLDEVTVLSLFLDCLPNLTHLALRNCPSTGKCLQEFYHPHLKALYILYDPHERRIMINMAVFLARFEGLETLSIRDIWKYRASRDAQFGSQILGAAIGLHEETLTFLHVHLNHQVYRYSSHFKPIIEAALKCKKLTQLGLSLSPRRLYVTSERILRLLTCLVTLRVDIEHSMSYLAMWHLSSAADNSAYSNVISRIADKTMEEAQSQSFPSKFALLCFGYSVDINRCIVGPMKTNLDGGPDNLGTCDCQHTFVTSEAFVFRRNGSEAIPISPMEAKVLVPESNIINFRERFFNCD